MNAPTLSADIDGSKYSRFIDAALLARMYEVLDVIDSLYDLQKSGAVLYQMENQKYNEIIALLYSLCELLPEKNSVFLKSQIKGIENGIYDLAALEIPVSDKNIVYLIFGKIVSSKDSKRYYSAALGIEEGKFYDLLAGYKKVISQNADNLKLINSSQLNYIAHQSNPFKCINAIKFSGFINKGHIPFSLFYSGGGRQQLSSLSNAVLFVNIYFERFNLISWELGKEYIDSRNMTKNIRPDVLRQILILWMWGHDAGHFIKEDNLKHKVSEHYGYLYEVLHELRSDIFSLYLLKELSGQFLDIKKQQVHEIFAVEMLRYIRMADFKSKPDSVSAYLVFMFMLHKRAISLDLNKNKVVLKFEEFGKIIDELLSICLGLFKKSSFEDAEKFLNMFSTDSGFEHIEKNMRLSLTSSEIPQYIKLI
ncbi:MAG: hypothetical protein GWM89_02170 [Candidatus Dadabacteria bacterium]|nr:hypothetical protein [Candidatus Dadabacteria bacterium]NIX14701.1 hypothetical protein [Candidatus Dadabacteria bacterium]NIY21237.1 hypothetical protein [Candidatus Dadabacteria bacterium]